LEKEKKKPRVKKTKVKTKKTTRHKKAVSEDQTVTQELVNTELRHVKFRNFKDRIRKVIKRDDPDHETRFERKLSTRVWPMLLPFIVVMIFLIILPLITMVIYSFVESSNDALQFKSTFENFAKLFTNAGIMLALLYSIGFALVAAIFTVIFGYPIAFIMSNLKSKILARNTWVLVTMPMWISMLLKVLGLQSLFYLLSPTLIGTPIAIIIGMTYMFLPFAITPIYDALTNRSHDLEEASRDLGASAARTFWTITFRDSMPGVLTGFSLVLIQASTSLIVVHYLGAGKITLISSVIESYFFRGSNFGYGAAIAVVLTLLVFLLMLIIRLFSNRFEKKGKRKKWKNSSKVPTLQ